MNRLIPNVCLNTTITMLHVHLSILLIELKIITTPTLLKALVRFFHAEDGVLKGTDVISSTQNLFAINIKYLHISTMGRFLFERGTMWFLSYRFSYDTIALGPVMRVSVYPSSFLLYHQRFVPQMELRFQQMEIQCPRNYFHQAWLVGWPSWGGEG
jgi:hypothetical protein